jgi:hypothetical protein
VKLTKIKCEPHGIAIIFCDICIQDIADEIEILNGEQ